MSVFQYPKGKHRRTITPRTFRRYQSYKKYLQHEFKRICVYCRQPDCAAPGVVFSVDHYRPKGIPAFSGLVCEYANLFYCCVGCNSRKGDDWPPAGKDKPVVVNPCDHDMASHLRFDARSGEIESRSANGKHMIALLDLNGKEIVKYRQMVTTIVPLHEAQIRDLKSDEKLLIDMHGRGDLTDDELQAELATVLHQLQALTESVERMSGSLALPPLPRRRNGLTLVV